MPVEQPTIWDILGYSGQGSPEEHDSADMLSYLADLFQKSTGGFDEWSESFGGGNYGEFDIYSEDATRASSGEVTDFRDIDASQVFRQLAQDPDAWRDLESEEDIQDYFSTLEFNTPYQNPETGEYGWEQKGGYKLMGDEDYLGDSQRGGGGVEMIQALQEALKAIPTAESFGLDRKMGDIETAGKRELKSAREGYIPGEILSRYGALQGKAGAQQKGEQLEQAYTEDIYGVQRGMGRDVRSTYEDFEDEWFGGVESWIGGLG